MQENVKVKKGKKVLDFVIKTMNGMAYGLFSTLIVGTILATIGGFFNESSYIGKIIVTVAKFLQNMTGLGIGLGVAWSLKLDGLKMIKQFLMYKIEWNKLIRQSVLTSFF